MSRVGRDDGPIEAFLTFAIFRGPRHGLALQATVRYPLESIEPELCADRAHKAIGGAVCVVHSEFQITNPQPVDKAYGRLEVLLDLFEGDETAETLLSVKLGRAAQGLVVTVQPGRFALLVPDIRLHASAVQHPRIQIEKINAVDAVVLVGAGITVRDDHAERRFPQHIQYDHKTTEPWRRLAGI